MRAMRWGLPLTMLLALLVLVLPGCKPKACETSDNCPAGTICTDTGLCQTIQCGSSNDCPVENWCNLDTGDCEAGCLSDNDCLPSEKCDVEQRECIKPTCRSTQLDCEFGQFCNQLSGACFDAGGNYCKSCERSEDCGATGNNLCLRFGGQLDSYCGVDCSAGQECPRGYDCVRVTTSGQATLSYQCIAACWELDP